MSTGVLSEFQTFLLSIWCWVLRRMTDKGIFTVAKLCKRLKTANVTNCTFTKKMTNYLKIKRGLRWRLVIAKTKKTNAPTVEMKYWPGERPNYWNEILAYKSVPNYRFRSNPVTPTTVTSQAPGKEILLIFVYQPSPSAHQRYRPPRLWSIFLCS